MEQSRIEDEIQSALDGTTYELPEDPLASRLEKLIQELINKGGGGGGTTITVDSELSLISTNPVQNKIITEALNDLQDSVDNLTEIPDMGTDDANDIFNFTRASGTSTKYQIGIYKAGASNTPDTTKDWLIISFIGPGPDYISDQIALTYGGTEKPEVYLRAHTSGTWTDWGKISGDVKENSSVDDGIVKKGIGEQWKFWSTNEGGEPDWRTPLYLALQNQLSVYQDPSANTQITGPIKGIKASAVTNEALLQDGFTVDQVSYQDGLVLAFTNASSQMSEILFTWGKGNVYYRVKATESSWSDWVLIASKEPLTKKNTKDDAGIVDAGSTGEKGQSWTVLDSDKNPGWGWPEKLKLEKYDWTTDNFIKNTIKVVDDYVGRLGIKENVSGDSKGFVIHFQGENEESNTQLVLVYKDRDDQSDVFYRYKIQDPENPSNPPIWTYKRLAYSSDIDTAISNLINGAPETLDTLKELADAISDNQDVVDALNDAIANKVDKVEGKGLSTNDYTDADKAAANTQVDWDVTSTSSPAYILHKPGTVSKWEDGFVKSPGTDNPYKVFMTNEYGNPGWNDIPKNTYNQDGIVGKPNTSSNQWRPQSAQDMWKSWCIPGTGESDPAWGYPKLMGGIETNFDETLSIPGTVGMYENFTLEIDGKIGYGCLLVVKPNTNQTTHIFLPQRFFSDFGIWYRVGKLDDSDSSYKYSDWSKIPLLPDLDQLFLPITGGKITTDGMELEIDGFGITGNGAQDITNFDVIGAMNLKGDKVYYNNEDTDKRYIKADSIPINTSTISGAVLAGAENPNKVWGTDEYGNPGWNDIPSSDISIEENPVSNLDDFIEGNEFKLGKFGNTTGNTPSSKPCLVMSFSSENGSYQLALDVAQNVFVRRQFGYGDTSWLPWDQVNMDRVESEATPNNLITKAHVRVGRYLSETDGDHWNAEEFPTPNFGGFIISFGNIDDSNNGMQYAISDDQNKYYRTASVTSTGTYTFGDWTAIPVGSTVENNTAEKAGIVAAGNTANSKSAVWGLDSDWNPVWKRLQELMIVDGTTPLTTEVDRVRFIKRYRWAVGLDTDETSTKTCYVLDLGADTEGNQINFIFDYDYDLLENRGVYVRYPSKDSDGDWAMSPPVKLPFSSDVVNLISEAVTELEGKIDLKANINSPALTGTPTAPTPEDSDNSTRIATTAFVKTLINALVNGAPETLDTLKEVADAIAENETVVEALNAAIGNKVDKVEGKGLSTNDFTNEDKNRVERDYLPLSGGTLTGDLYLNQPVRLCYRSTDYRVYSEIRNNVNTGGLVINTISDNADKEYPEITVNQFRNNMAQRTMKLLNKDGETEVLKLKLLKITNNDSSPGDIYRTDIVIGRSRSIYNDTIYIKNEDSEAGAWFSTEVVAGIIYFSDYDVGESYVSPSGLISGNSNVRIGIYKNDSNNKVEYFFMYNNINAANKTSTISLGTSIYKWKEVYAVNGQIQTSDRNEKNSLVELSVEKAEALIYGSKPTTYMMNSGSSGRIHWGLISQDLEELLEELGWSSLDFAGFIKSPKMTEPVFDEKTGKIIKESEVIEGEYTYSLRYDEFIAPIIKVEQSHNERIKELESKVVQQESEIADLKAQIEELKNLILGGGN